MNKDDRVKSTLLFNEIINKGNKVANNYFTCFYMAKKEEKPKFGVSAPKKNGNAVVRNKLKRQTRELISKSKLLFKNNRNYIIIIKKTCLDADFNTKLLALQSLIGEMNEK